MGGSEIIGSHFIPICRYFTFLRLFIHRNGPRTQGEITAKFGVDEHIGCL